MADTVGTGIMGKLGNKGGVSVRIDFHNTSICFVNSHLAADVSQCERRNQDYDDINARTVLTDNRSSTTRQIKDHDMIYWLGDLNYRINDLDTMTVRELLDKKQFEILLNNDQFRMQVKQRKIFVGYEEGPINFVPTYKYDLGTDNWDSSEKARTPSWTDRILWKAKGNSISLKSYQSHMSLKISDHKPVSAIMNAGNVPYEKSFIIRKLMNSVLSICRYNLIKFY